MAEGKWINGLGADLPTERAARLALAARLGTVGYYLPRALHHTEDPENVHQLRVSTRRAAAALRIFRDCLPEKEFKSARKLLRSLRRAAGAARDWDVFALDLAERRTGRPPKEHPGLDHLHGQALGRRAVAQDELKAVGQERFEDFEKFVTKVVGAVRPPCAPAKHATLIDVARSMLTALRTGLARASSADLGCYENLHQVRIAGKRLRYAMEIFADCFGPEFKDELYPQVEEMQEVLGRANDSHVAACRLTETRDHLKRAWPADWRRLRPGVEGLLRFHQRRLPQERRRFLAWWKRWQSKDEPAFDNVVG
jgi:CHAD domain-containing protein